MIMASFVWLAVAGLLGLAMPATQVLDLPTDWRLAFESAYSQLTGNRPKLLLTTYFGDLGDNLHRACHLPVDGLHLDLVRAPEQLDRIIDWLPRTKALSVGIIDGRNVWRADLSGILDRLEPLHARLGGRLWVAPSCSLLHVPVDLEQENGLDTEIRAWMAFATQKIGEVCAIKQALEQGREAVAETVKLGRQTGVKIQISHLKTAGAGNWQFVDELLPLAHELVLQKSRYDAFYGTSLDHYLKTVWEISTLIVVGTVSNICVLHTVGSANLRWLKVVVPADGISALSSFDQALTLHQIAHLYYGDVLESCDGITFQ